MMCLLVDDDLDDQEVFLSAVGQISNAVTCTALNNASEALHKLAVKELTADVIFLDLNMPAMNRQQFLIEVKKNQDLLKI